MNPRALLRGLWLLGALLGGFLAFPAQAKDTVYYYSSDALHSEVVITDANRNVVERTHYAPYGQVLNRSLREGPGYTGHAEDPGTGLVYMQQRYYDPVAGRFISADPVQATASGGNFNRYWYANDNPYRYTDPDGRAPDTDFGLGAMAQSFGGNPEVTNKMAPFAVAGVGVMLTASGLGEVVAIAKGAAIVGKALSGARKGATVTRYMGPEEAKIAARTGEIPNVGKDGIPRPTHVTKDSPVSSAAKAQDRYELPSAPTHRATVPANRVTDLGRTPDGRSTTSGGGSQNATKGPIPVKPDEIKRLKH